MAGLCCDACRAHDVRLSEGGPASIRLAAALFQHLIDARSRSRHYQITGI
jgi:hypothetical protein